MIWLLTLMILIYGKVDIKSISILITLNHDLSAEVVEEYLVEVYDMDNYTILYSNPNTTLSDWQNFINDTRFAYHVAGEGLIRYNTRLEFSQLYLKNYRSGLANISMKYNIKNIIDNLGLFRIINRTPRYDIVVFDPNYLTFIRSGAGYIMLSEIEELKFRFDDSFSVIRITPNPSIRDGREYVWTNTILNNPTIVLKRTTSYDHLIIEGMNRIYDLILKTLQKPIPLLYLFITLVFLIMTARVNNS
ncbi:MAG: hypothetical protein NZ908_01260 [Candidatus Micrarchaeota archaeon]|nr:hypothetical protein [Candidatus Micrarchaeota archaeon]MCX8154255.1 hypothetical protein [Candidatus Micrarchaeota archaeon]